MPHYGPPSALNSRPSQSPIMAPGMSSRMPHNASGGIPHPLNLSRDRGGDGYPLPTLPPPRPSSQASTESDRRSSRTFASVQSILNPSGDGEESRGRRRSAAQMEEDSQISPPISAVGVYQPMSSGGLMHDKSPPGFQGSRAGMPRRILTPISPTLHRTTSLNRIVVPGTIDAQSTPFLGNMSVSSSRSHSIEPASAGLPSLPPFSGLNSQRQSFSHSQGPTPPLQLLPRRKSVSVLPSARGSPTPSSYSGYSRSGQASPSFPYPPSTGPTPPGPLSLAGSPLVGPTGSVNGDNENYPVPVVTGGQSTWEYFTIPSARGFVSVPVEVHVASRQADEKRKRNAGASARFRQRRKEKEREANTTIDRLADELQYMTEDAEYYKAERDRLLEALKDLPDWERHLPRSLSPRLKRRAHSSHTVSTGGLTSGDMSPTSPLPPHSVELHGQLPSGNENERNTRRRIDSESSYHSSADQPQESVQRQSQPYQSQYPAYNIAPAPPRDQRPHGHNPNNNGAPFHSHAIPTIDSNRVAATNYEQPWSAHSMAAGR